jgi:uncharacterized damage-inducible protein DinB
MNTEVQSILRNLQNILDGDPWFGRSVYSILEEIHPVMVYTRPGENSHSIIDLLYHINTWAEFALKRLLKEEETDMQAFEERDWRIIDPHIHTWANALQEFKTAHEGIIQVLQKMDDSLLEEKVDYREYNFRFLLNGLIQHDIYHLAQIAYAKKILA